MECLYYLDCSNEYQGRFRHTMVVGRSELDLMFAKVIVADVHFPHQELAKYCRRSDAAI